MALLRTGLRKPSALALAAMAITGAGCVLLARVAPQAPRFAFPHAVHVEEGLECADCHPGTPETDEPGMPAQAQCRLCHEDIDEEKPPEKRIAALFAPPAQGGAFLAVHAARVDPEVIFSHARHAAAVEDCAACHAGIAESVRIGPEMHLSMDDCMACHASMGAPNECATCHTEIRTDVAPATHAENWTKVHGQFVRWPSEELADRCVLCHTESTCTSCHADTPPENHNHFWRIRGHGIAAEIDRDNCATCHRPDSCEACHAEALPRSHHGMWGAPRSTHCVSCHFPLGSDACVTCHKGTPSHATATPMPPWHNPGMDCRMCHGPGLGQPLPHADNGSSCVMCHM